MINYETYGEGGYDPKKPNGNIVETGVDNGDGTATVTTWIKGKPKVRTVECEIVPPAPASDVERLAMSLVAKVDGYELADAAKALGCDEDRLAAIADELAAEPGPGDPDKG